MKPGWLAAALLVAVSGGGAQAERLVVSLSSQQVAISSNFRGSAVTLFGIVERDAQSATRASAYDLVVTLRGPRETVTIRRKEPFGPIWLNRDQQKFAEIPALLGIYATQPLSALVDDEFRRKTRIGIDAIIGAPDVTLDRGGSDEPFRAALIRLKARSGLYVENGNAAAFITDTFFRARLPLPANAPLGDYVVEAALLSQGSVLARETARFTVMKAGIEEQLSHAARDHSVLYGLGTAAMALAVGWLASVIFRRD